MNLALLASIGLSLAVVGAAASGAAEKSAESKPSCCAKGSDGAMKCDKPAAEADGAKHAGEEGHKMQCSLTGKVVNTCCCVEREGKMHCTLADKDVTECCCKPVEDEQSAKAN